jgi:hypothetical protein
LIKSIQKYKFWAVALLIIIVVILSSIIGAGLLDNEIRTGGMETKWKLDTNTGDGAAYRVNSSIIVNDANAMAIKSINSDGEVVWSRPYIDLVSFSHDNNTFFLIDKHNGTSTLNVLGEDGSLKWDFSEPGLDGCNLNAGHLFLHVSDNFTTDTILCLDVNGTTKWEYTDSDILSVWGAFPNGTAILEHDNAQVSSGPYSIVGYATSDNFLDEFISISPHGTEMGMRNITGSSYWYMGQASNGTILADNMTGGEVGLTANLEKMWPLGNQSSVEGPSSWSQTIGSTTYNLTWNMENGSDPSTTLTAYHTGDDVQLYRTEFRGTLSLPLYVNGETTFVAEIPNFYWAVDSDGQAYRSNDTEMGMPLGIYGDGLLIWDEHGFELINSRGSTEWQFNLTQNNDRFSFFLVNDTIILATNNGITAIYKPQISTTMMEMVGLVGVDLLIVLLGSMWLLDQRFHRNRKES